MCYPSALSEPAGIGANDVANAFGSSVGERVWGRAAAGQNVLRDHVHCHVACRSAGCQPAGATSPSRPLCPSSSALRTLPLCRPPTRSFALPPARACRCQGADYEAGHLGGLSLRVPRCSAAGERHHGHPALLELLLLPAGAARCRCKLALQAGCWLLAAAL
jgi:hypothetical protein